MIVWVRVESETFRLQPVEGVSNMWRQSTGIRDALSIHGGSCLDGEEGACAIVVKCESFPVITSRLDSKSEEIQLVGS